jgi:hypothetical protein
MDPRSRCGGDGKGDKLDFLSLLSFRALRALDFEQSKQNTTDFHLGCQMRYNYKSKFVIL